MSSPDSRRLLAWIVDQRWYAGRHREASSASIIASISLGDGEHQVTADIVEIGYATGGSERYFVPGLSDIDPATIGALWRALLAPRAGFAATVFEQLPHEPTTMRALEGDQSNSSVLVDDEWVLKIIRRLEPGPNPEVELGAALLAHAATRVAPLAGALRLSAPDGTDFDVMTVHRRVAGDDGFQLALADARAEYDGRPGAHFPGAAYELGIALGALHDDLTEAFGTRTSKADRARIALRMSRRLEAVAGLAELASYTERIRERYDAFAAGTGSLELQRIHGDLHLGQTLFGPDGWVFLDFEGEPREPLAERRSPDTPLRDIAGILRSFEYAALWEAPDTGASTGQTWRERNAELFIEGYELQRGERIDADVLEVFELDKAVYEVGYEAAHRPERVSVPVRAVRRLLGDTEPLR